MVMHLAHLEDPTRTGNPDWRSLPRGRQLRIKSSADAGEKVKELLRECLRSIGDRPLTPSECFHVASTLKLLADLRRDEAITDQIIGNIENRIAALEQFAELFR